MQDLPALWPDPIRHLVRHQPDHPVLYFDPAVLQDTARFFQANFDGLVTYAVKANDRPEVLSNLSAAGISAFDVASPVEIEAVRAIAPHARLHYNNPVRSEAEIAQGMAAGVASWAVDEASELAKLKQVPRDAEIAVRFALPVGGGAYDFGEKFGATPQEAATLLGRVAAMGFQPALGFHPGTQCQDPEAWARYIEAASAIAGAARVRIARLNVGGGFAAFRGGDKPLLAPLFDRIRDEASRSFAGQEPQLFCEPGRAMVAEACTLALRIKSLRHDGRTLYLNDGIYGALADLRDMGLTGRLRVLSPDGTLRQGQGRPRVVFGPTCDSLDRLPDGLPVPEDAVPGDYLLFDGFGAYSIAMSTRFNGYGLTDVVTVGRIAGQVPAKGYRAA